MAGISDLIQTMGAIIIFSLILLTANRMILSNTAVEVETEAEKVAVSMAQSVIKKAQTLPFDANTANGSIPDQLPEGFSSCGPGSGESNPEDFNDFDDYDGYSTQKNTPLGNNSFTIEVAVSYVSESDGYDMSKGNKGNDENNRTFFKKMVVTVTSAYFENSSKEIKLSYLRRYYKTTN